VLRLLLFVAFQEGGMGKNVTMYVEQRSDEAWAVKRPNSKRASAVMDSKKEAIERAHEIADGGPVHIQGPDGRWRKEQRTSK
jgi:uncharacterized protein YdaT